MGLTESQFKKLVEAFLEEFPTYAELKDLTRDWLGQDLGATPEDDLKEVISKLIRDMMEPEDKMARLINAARAARPDNPTFSELAQKLGLTSTDLSHPQLERTIRRANGLLDLPTWRAKLAEIENQVCRVEIKLNKGRWYTYGTGFLVGPSILLTNYHVMEPVIEVVERRPKGDKVLWAEPEDVVFQFDYKTLPGGNLINQGTEYKLADDWLIDFSPMSPYDEVPEPQKQGLPKPDQLDYVLIRLSNKPIPQAVGPKSDPDLLSRGWIALPTVPYNFEPHTTLLIVQHPERSPIKLGLDTDAIIGGNGNETRVTYKTNTEKGSSGSPCFDIDWNLVALHHAGDPNFDKLHHPGYNQGIPMVAIVTLLEKRGKLDELKKSITNAYEKIVATPPASSELRILVAPFIGGLSGYKIYPDRDICDALRKHIDRLNPAEAPVLLAIQDTRSVNQNEIRALGDRHRATLVIWGGRFDDRVGIQPFIEIMTGISKPYLRQLGFWLPVGSLFPTQITLDALPKKSIEQLNDYADYLALLSLGIALVIGQQPAQAEKLFTQVLKIVQSKDIWPNKPHEVYYWRGLAFSMQELHQKARGDLIKSSSLNSKSKYVLVQRGNVTLTVGRARAAHNDFKEALKRLYPRDQAEKATLSINAGLALELQNEPEKALEDYQKAWEISQIDDPNAIIHGLFCFGDLCRRQELFAEGIVFYNKMLELCKKENFRQRQAEALGYIGLICHKQGRMDDAKCFYQDALAIYTKENKNCLEWVKQLIWLGLLHLKQENTDIAEAILSEALGRSREVGSSYWKAQAQIGLALVERQRGNNENARMRFHEAERLLDQIGAPEVEVLRLAIQGDIYKAQQERLTAGFFGSDTAFLLIGLIDWAHTPDVLSKIFELDSTNTARKPSLQQRISRFIQEDLKLNDIEPLG